MTTSGSWFFWALLSACFAALTAIFAKLGIQNVDSDLATLIRTLIITLVLAAFVWSTGKWSSPQSLSSRTWIFLTLSALATGASWVCYFRALQKGAASQVAPVDKFSLVLVALFAVAFLGERPSGRAWLGIGMVAVGVLVLASGAMAAVPPATAAETEHLFVYLAGSGCEFYRNGQWYTPAAAREHLQTKYQYLLKRDLIKTTEDFIRLAATESSMSHKAYQVRCGTDQQSSASWFGAELLRFREKNGAKQR